MPRYVLSIGGSTRAREQYKSGRIYAHKSSAVRRMHQIRSKRDFGVTTIWIMKIR